MATKLKNLVITKVALVDEGACSEAHIQLYKRKPTGGVKMEYEEILKSLPEEQQEVIKAKMTASEAARMKAEEEKKKLEEEKAAMQMEKEATEAELTKMKKAKSPESSNEAEILKSLAPEVRDLIEKSRSQAQAAEEAVKKMRDEQLNTEAINKAKTVEALGTTDTLADIYKSLKKSDEVLCDKVFDVLQKANALVTNSSALDEIGKAATDTTGADSWSKIEKAAETVAKSRNISKANAISAVMTEQPELYEQYIKEQEM